jgi:FKBP-type peptidyl-prolyl cis-trans isomerase
MNDKVCAVVLFIVMLFLAGCGGKENIDLDPGIYAFLETTRGTVIIRLEYEKVPMLAANFIGLAEGVFTGETGKKERFYDNSRFYDVEDGILIKGGMPVGKDRLRSTYYLPENFHPDLKHDRPGAVSMVKEDTNIHGSLFSISLKKTTWLDYKQPVFGYVVLGIENAQAIRQNDLCNKVTIKRIGETAGEFIVTPQGFVELKNQVEQKNLEEKQARENEVIASLREEWPDLVQTRSGMYFFILKQGKGRTPAVGTEAIVKYTGRLVDGTVFMDTSAEEGGVKKVIVGKVLRGLNEALLTMRKGERRIVVVPPEMGFGGAGLEPIIPPYSFLVFDVELIDF